MRLQSPDWKSRAQRAKAARARAGKGGAGLGDLAKLSLRPEQAARR